MSSSRPSRRLARWITLVAGFALLAGCAGRRLVPREYLLTPLASAPASADDAMFPDFALGVGPVNLPGYLQRPQIVTRRSENRLYASAAHKWAETLEGNMTRVLARNLALLLPTNRVATFPWQSPGRLDYRVAVEVNQFDRSPEDRVALDARWFITGPGNELLAAERSAVSTPVSGTGYEATVDAMSAAVAELSREIAAAIRAHARHAAAVSRAGERRAQPGTAGGSLAPSPRP
jgi:hypothetical protein